MTKLERVLCVSQGKIGDYVFKTQTMFLDTNGNFVTKNERIAINNATVIDEGLFITCMDNSEKIECIGVINPEICNVKVAISSKVPRARKKNQFVLLNEFKEPSTNITVKCEFVQAYGYRYIACSEDGTKYYVIVNPKN